MHRRLLLLALLFFAHAAFAQTVETPPATLGGQVIKSIIEESRMEELRWPDFPDYRKHLHNFYAPRGYALTWTADGKPTPQTRALIALFEGADVKGINAVDYDGTRWEKRIAALPPAAGEAASSTSETALARFDVAVSITLMRYISDLHIGRINPHNVRFDLDIETKKYYLPKLLTDIAVSDNPATILTEVEPQYEEYRKLQAALADYRRFAVESKGEKPLPVVKKLSPGEIYPALPQLARLLKRLGDLPATHVFNPVTYDTPLVGAVKHFQARHGLEPDGIISERTFRALNVPMSRRVRQIQLALERWRWAPMGFEQPPIVVNIPEFRLRAWDDTHGRAAVQMRVVVGQTVSHQTPVFAGDMRYVVLRPYWNVPPTIQRSEIVPKLERDRGYLAANNYEIISEEGTAAGSKVDQETLAKLRSGDLRVRQKPGPTNALGLIKFMFPNQNNVYLHSTPSQTLFSRSRRDFSHGCIRVEDPVALAAWVLRDQPEWTPDRIRDAMVNGDTKSLSLKSPLPIMIIYTTAAALEDGIHFYEDIYGHDATLENALAGGYPYPA
jgi:murein L,D-transpeptidase YcbB/YkuD